MVAVADRVRRARDVLAHAERRARAAHERRLAGAELAGDGHDVADARAARQAPPRAPRSPPVSWSASPRVRSNHACIRNRRDKRHRPRAVRALPGGRAGLDRRARRPLPRARRRARGSSKETGIRRASSSSSSPTSRRRSAGTRRRSTARRGSSARVPRSSTWSPSTGSRVGRAVSVAGQAARESRSTHARHRHELNRVCWRASTLSSVVLRDAADAHGFVAGRSTVSIGQVDARATERITATSRAIRGHAPAGTLIWSVGTLGDRSRRHAARGGPWMLELSATDRSCSLIRRAAQRRDREILASAEPANVADRTVRLVTRYRSPRSASVTSGAGRVLRLATPIATTGQVATLRTSLAPQSQVSCRAAVALAGGSRT